MDPSLGGAVVGVTCSFSFHPRHLLFAELSWTRARHDPSQGLKGQVLGGIWGHSAIAPDVRVRFLPPSTHFGSGPSRPRSPLHVP